MAKMSSSQQHAERPQPQPRSAYAQFVRVTTRWADNDAYGHVNNVVYYSWFDTAVNRLLIEKGVLDIEASSSIGLVVETQCHYFAPVSYPQDVDVGVRVAHLGKSSVRYELAIFVAGESQSAACGHFVHVYVDRSSRRPVALPDATRQALDSLRLP
ncbi:acyl-CoA thioesterase [Comamonas sp. MYb21]|uniref:acyl-CoA thioesterase n=1 Tax=Comamonas sp. MYb21 TaxID=1848648 RepID=UPI00403F3432